MGGLLFVLKLLGAIGAGLVAGIRLLHERVGLHLTYEKRQKAAG